jgi:hypothetical protein
MRPVQISDLTTGSAKLSCQTTMQTLSGQTTWLEHTKLAGRDSGVPEARNSNADGKRGGRACDQAKESLSADKLKSGHADMGSAGQAEDTQGGWKDSEATTSHLKTVYHNRPRGMTKSTGQRRTRPTWVTQPTWPAQTTRTQRHRRQTEDRALPQPAARARGEHQRPCIVQETGEGSPKAHASQGER